MWEIQDAITWKSFLHYWLFVHGIHWPPMHSPHKGTWLWCLLCFFWLNKLLNTQLSCWWFEMPWCSRGAESISKFICRFYINIYVDFILTLKWCWWSKSFNTDDKNPFILCSQWHDYWWTGNQRGQCISSHGIDTIPVFPKSRQHVCFVRRRIQMSDVEFVKIISIWCLSIQFGRHSMKSIQEDCNSPWIFWSQHHSLWSSAAIWWLKSGSTLAQVMVCCLMHNLKTKSQSPTPTFQGGILASTLQRPAFLNGFIKSDINIL